MCGVEPARSASCSCAGFERQLSSPWKVRRPTNIGTTRMRRQARSLSSGPLRALVTLRRTARHRSVYAACDLDSSHGGSRAYADTRCAPRPSGGYRAFNSCLPTSQVYICSHGQLREQPQGQTCGHRGLPRLSWRESRAPVSDYNTKKWTRVHGENKLHSDHSAYKSVSVGETRFASASESSRPPCTPHSFLWKITSAG